LSLRRIDTIWPPRSWWVGLAVILVAVGVLRYTGYTFSLPYVDHSDEASYTLAGRMIIDSGSAKPLGMHGYPPGIITVNYVLLKAFHDPTTPPTSMIWMVRWWSVFFSIGTVAVVALLAEQVMPRAGLISALIWGGAPAVTTLSRYATPDSFITFFGLLALWQSLVGLQFNREGWNYAALVSVLIAILFKYQAVFLLPSVMALPLLRWLNPNVKRRRVLVMAVRMLVIVAVFFFWLVILYPGLEANQAPNWSAANDRFGFPTPAILWANVVQNYRDLAVTPVWAVGWIGLLALVWRPVRELLNRTALGMAVVSAVAYLVGMSFYGAQGAQFFRQYLIYGGLITVLAGVGWAALLAVTDRLIPQRTGGWRYAPMMACVVLVIGIQWPLLRASYQEAQLLARPDRRNALMVYADQSLPPAPMIVNQDNHKTFNNAWGGYFGQHEFRTEVGTLESRPIAEWRAQGFEYAVLSFADYERFSATVDETERQQVLILKDYPPSDAYRSGDMRVLRLRPIDIPLDATLGAIRYVGAELSATTVTAGDRLTIEYVWQADAPTSAGYRVFNHLLDADGELIAQIDGVPLEDERRASTTWDDPTERLLSRPFVLDIPADLPAGEYTLVSGFYEPTSGRRLVAEDGNSTVTVATIRVNPF